jgi:hypothetical protein
MSRPKAPKPLSNEQFVARHAALLVEMAKWPNGTPSTEATPGWAMARFVGMGLAIHEKKTTRIGVEVLFSLTDAGRRTAAVLTRSVERGRR